jgi:hypothetical protein
MRIFQNGQRTIASGSGSGRHTHLLLLGKWGVTGILGKSFLGEESKAGVSKKGVKTGEESIESETENSFPSGRSTRQSSFRPLTVASGKQTSD